MHTHTHTHTIACTYRRRNGIKLSKIRRNLEERAPPSPWQHLMQSKREGRTDPKESPNILTLAILACFRRPKNWHANAYTDTHTHTHIHRHKSIIDHICTRTHADRGPGCAPLIEELPHGRHCAM
jgi:hypothetical protein